MAEATVEEGNSSASMQAVTKQPEFQFYENFTRQIQGQIGITSNFLRKFLSFQQHQIRLKGFSAMLETCCALTDYD